MPLQQASTKNGTTERGSKRVSNATNTRARKDGNANANDEAENEASDDDDDDNDDDDDDEVDDDDGDPTQTIVDMGRHARMQRIQKVLFDQLVGNDARISLELREREEELRRVKQAREDTGVTLYGVQQQLAQLQLALETSHRKLGATHDARFASEDTLDDAKTQLSDKKLAAQRHRQQLHKTQSELDALNATLRQVEAFSTEMKHEIARTQRAAQKAEATMAAIEKDKVQQDVYIDSLSEQAKRLREQLALTAAQHKTQKSETAAATDTLREAAAQMENVAFEKKQLLQQWKSSVVGLTQRDAALEATQTAIAKAVEDELVVAAEARGYKQSIAKAQATHETLVGTIERFNAEIRFVEDQTATLRADHARLSERFELLTKSLRQTEAQTSSAATASKKLELATAQVTTHLETTQRERHALEDAINAQKSAQTTVHKAAHNIVVETQRVQAAVHAKEIALANLRNELARVGVDVLNVETHVATLDATQQQLVRELKAEDVHVEKLELERRQRTDAIEKKMLRLDRLNKKYEQLVANVADEHTGPLEAQIKHLVTHTAEVRAANAQRQRHWLATQTALVHVSAAAQDVSERNQELRSTASVLEQKHLRLESDAAAMARDIKDLRNGLTALHADTGKLNDLIARSASRHSELLDRNHALEQTCRRDLQDLEADAVRLEQVAATLKRDKHDLLERVVEVERQLMLWEKKIQLEKETQAALDPDVGQVEARAMEKEIHRMRLRLEALQRSQEQMLQDMESAIHKRDALSLRARSKKDAELTVAALAAKAATLANNARKNYKDVATMDRALKKALVSSEDVAFQLDKVAAERKIDDERAVALQTAINNALYDKQRYIDAEARKLRLIKRFENLRRAAGSGNGGTTDSDVRARDELDKAQRALDNAKHVVALLQQQSPHLSDVLARVLLLADEPPV